ncbi:sugar phosphate isomerase/epimerase family protein [Gryllotalpicola reticulitermitis]|uniref:Sugar phosphate isomerase/epimerase family protein n=1 Tax=Gryllotalpicola reticulitermitis TaxID=1184153 RepID=A0ABV8Q2S7_9MICO
MAASGFTGIGIGLPDLLAARKTIGYGGLRELIAEAGLTRTEVEFLGDWFAPAGPARSDSDRDRAALLDAAESLGAHHIKLGGGAADAPADTDTVLTELQRLGDEASACGTRIALEPGADSALADYPRTFGLVAELDHPAVGMMLDIWHLFRVGLDYTTLPELVRPQDIVAVELSDGLPVPIGSIFEDTFDHRLLPGKGAFDVRSFVAEVRKLGFDGPWGLELMSDELRRMPVPQVLDEARDAALAVL